MRFFFVKVNFLKTVDTKVIILTWYAKINGSVAMNKFQSDFDHSATVAHIWVSSIF